MGSEIFKPDANFKAGGVVGGYSSADAAEATSPTKIALRINPTTLRLLVDVNGATTVTDGEAVDAADTGTLFLGTDGSNYQIVKTDSDGNLQVDIVSGGGAGTQYTEGDTDASITGTALMLEGAANTLVAAPGTAADGLLVNLGTNNDVVVTNAGTFAVQVDGAALTSLQLLDNAISGAGFNITQFGGAAVPIGAGVEATALRVTLATDSTGVISIDDNGGIITVDGTVTANLSATDNAVLDAIAASVAAIDTDTTTIIGHVDGIEGLLTTIDADTSGIITAVQLIDDTIFVAGTDTYTEATSKGQLMLAVRRDADTTLANTTNEFVPFQVDANGYLKVEIFDGGGSHTVDNGGTFVVQENGAALTALQLIDNAISGAGFNITQFGGTNVVTAGVSGMLAVGGNIAHDTADTSNPLKIGGRAQEPTAALEEVSADNDRVDAAFDRQGRLAVWNGYPVQSAVINTSTSGDNTIVSALGAGLRIAVIGCVIISDGTTDVRWEDGASGTAKTGQMPLQAREGFVMPIGNQPWFVGAANTLLNLELTAAVNVHGIVSYITMTD